MNDETTKFDLIGAPIAFAIICTILLGVIAYAFTSGPKLVGKESSYGNSRSDEAR